MQNDLWLAAVSATLGALIAGVFAWAVQWRKSETDQEVAVLAEWSKLYSSVSDRLATVERKFSEYREEVAQQFEEMRRKHATEIDEMRRKHREEMKSMRELNEGLQRQIAQNSKSTAHLMGETPVTPMKDEGDAA